MTNYEIPLTLSSKIFSIKILDVTYRFQIYWRGTVWSLDINDQTNTPIVCGILLVPSLNLLEQFQYLLPDFKLSIYSEGTDDIPTYSTLGVTSHLILSF